MTTQEDCHCQQFAVLMEDTKPNWGQLIWDYTNYWIPWNLRKEAYEEMSVVYQ